jgi:hypothetical protein
MEAGNVGAVAAARCRQLADGAPLTACDHQCREGQVLTVPVLRLELEPLCVEEQNAVFGIRWRSTQSAGFPWRSTVLDLTRFNVIVRPLTPVSPQAAPSDHHQGPMTCSSGQPHRAIRRYVGAAERVGLASTGRGHRAPTRSPNSARRSHQTVPATFTSRSPQRSVHQTLPS